MQAPIVVLDIEEAHSSALHKHTYSSDEAVAFRRDLQSWFASNARALPWRSLPLDEPDKRAYGIWVSEIMLQQTRVATVINYWERWMQRWPTVADLAAARLEEVNELWAGLGYYRRAALLLEGAKHVMSKLNGHLPRTPEMLREIPGIGPYTAGAIASIAFNEPAPLVDGNVMRVFARHRAVRASSKHAPFVKHCWSLAAALVDRKLAGKFNEALMELGATVCTPQKPLCTQCPVNSSCAGYKLFPNGSIAPVSPSSPSPSCSLCDLTSPPPLSVAALPLKAVKSTPRPIWTSCVLIELAAHPEPLYLLQQRPKKGLLANLWEFPGITQDPAPEEIDLHATLIELKALLKSLCAPAALPSLPLVHIGDTFHQFSHISQNISVHLVTLAAGSVDPLSTKSNSTQWLSRSAIGNAAVSKGVHKCLAILDQHREGGGKAEKKQKSGSKSEQKRDKPLTKKARTDTTGKDSKKRGKQQGSLDAFLPASKLSAQASSAGTSPIKIISDSGDAQGNDAILIESDDDDEDFE